LIGISYDLWTFGIPRAFSDGIRAGNAVRLQLEVKLMHYSDLEQHQETRRDQAQNDTKP
jgi:hypothetical protein